MKMQRVNITLPHTLIRTLQVEIPTGKRSSFIATAVSEKLGKKKNMKKELEKSLKANYEFDKTLAKEWENLEAWSE